MKTPVIKRVLILVLIFFSISCSNRVNTDSLFMDTYIGVLTKEIFEFRNIRPPTPEEFKKGIRDSLPSIRDTINPLRLYVQNGHLEVEFSNFIEKLPEEFNFISDTVSEIVDYLPEKIERYSTQEYEFIEFNSLSELSESNENLELNYGRILQFSKVLLNPEQNKAILFVRDTYDELDSVERLVLLGKNNGKWKVVKSILISFA